MQRAPVSCPKINIKRGDVRPRDGGVMAGVSEAADGPAVGRVQNEVGDYLVACVCGCARLDVFGNVGEGQEVCV